MLRPFPWKPVAIATTVAAVLLLLLFLPACCCVHGPATVAVAPPAQVPRIETQPIPTPTVAQAKAPVQTMMRNVDFHVDADTILKIHFLRGIMLPKTPGAPLRDLHITMAGAQLVQQGIMHKIVDIPFTMWANVSADHGRIRLHPTKIRICSINGLGLLKAVGMTLQKMLKMPGDRGVAADGNDLLLDPQKMLPPPKTKLHLVRAYVEGKELMQVFDAGMHLPDLHPPHPEESDMMYYRGGTLRFGKLLIVDADMEVVGTDPRVPFDFDLDHYNDQLVAGYSRNQPNYGLLVFMRGFKDLGTPAEAGGAPAAEVIRRPPRWPPAFPSAPRRDRTPHSLPRAESGSPGPGWPRNARTRPRRRPW